jgi:hypothetical protein
MVQIIQDSICTPITLNSFVSRDSTNWTRQADQCQEGITEDKIENMVEPQSFVSEEVTESKQ